MGEEGEREEWMRELEEERRVAGGMGQGKEREEGREDSMSERINEV